MSARNGEGRCDLTSEDLAAAIVMFESEIRMDRRLLDGADPEFVTATASHIATAEARIARFRTALMHAVEAEQQA